MFSSHFLVKIEILVVIIGLLSFWTKIADAAAISGAWSVIDETYDSRQKPGIWCEANEMHIFGGQTSRSASGTVYLNSLFNYRTDTGISSEVFSPSGVAPHHASTTFVKVGTEAFVFGGSTAAGMTNSIHKFEFTTKRWSELSVTGSPPSKRSRFASWRRGTDLIVFSGMTEEGPDNQVWKFDTLTSTWTMLHTGVTGAPEQRFDPCCVYLASTDAAVCFGGTTVLKDLNDVWTFHHVNSSWTQLTVLGTVFPPPRRLAVCEIVNNDTFFAMSGFSSGLADYIDDGTLWKISLTSRQWSGVYQPANETLVYRDSAKACQNADGIFVLAGAGSPLPKVGGGRNDIWKLDTTTFIFTLVVDNVIRPEGRAGHNAVLVGGAMYMAFGHNHDGILNDIWKYNLTSDKWEKLSPPDAPLGRTGAAATALGNTIYFYGGRTANGLTNELLGFQSTTNEWAVISQVQTITAVADHSLVAFQSQLLLFGGTSETELNSPLLQVFDFHSQSWVSLRSAISPAGATLQWRRGHRMIFDPVSSGFYLFGGTTGVEKAEMDVWYFNNLVSDMSRTTWNINIAKLTSTPLTGTILQQYIRTNAAVAGVHHRYLVCGGEMTPSFPAPLTDQCYQYDANTGENIQITDMPIPNSEASAVYYGRKVYIFGGQLSGSVHKKGVYLDQMQVFTFPAASMCAAVTNNSTAYADATCISCSTGTKNPSCLPSTAGHYSTNPFIAEVPCAEGEFLSYEGAASVHNCRYCPAGTYSSVQGANSCQPCTTAARCPIGSHQDDAAEARGDVPTVTVTQPPRFSGETIPTVLGYAVAAFTGGMILVFLFLVGITGYIRGKKLEWYFTKDNLALLLDIFDDHEVIGYGLDESALYNSLTDPRLNCGISAEQCSDLFRDQDEDGSGYSDYEEFCRIIIYLIESGQMTPMKGSPAEEQGEYNGCTVNFRFASFDQFMTSHQIGRAGDAIKMQRTRGGGILTVLFRFSAIVVVALLVVTFYFSNLEQTSSTIPVSVLDREVYGDISVRASLHGSGDQSATVPCPRTADVSWVETDSGAKVNATFETKCEYGKDVTVVISHCYACQISLGHPVTVSVDFHPNTYASFITLEIRTKTAVTDEGDTVYDSIGEINFDPLIRGNVFRGMPASTTEILLTPTVFRTVDTIWTQRYVYSVGYHLDVANSHNGHTVNNNEFTQFFGVPVEVKLVPLEVALVVDRLPTQSLLQMVSSILGALSGLSAGLLAVVQYMDAAGVEERYEKWLAEMEQKKPKAPMNLSDTQLKSVERDRKLLEGLLAKHVNFGVAVEHLKLMRAVLRSADARGTPLMPEATGTTPVPIPAFQSALGKMTPPVTDEVMEIS